MPTFAYAGRTRAGENVSGERMADSMDAAVAALRREQIQVTRITPAAVKAAAKGAKPGSLGKGVTTKSLAVFTRQFSVMIDAGLPLVQCLDILGNQEEDKNFAAVILATRADVEGGATLADAMRKHPKTFDSLFCNMIAAGEAGGILDTILKRLAQYIEKAAKLTSEVKSAMMYPVFIIVFAGIIVAAIMVFVIPTFAKLFNDLGATLPFMTRLVMALSDFIAGIGGIAVVAAGAVVAFLVRRYYATDSGRHVIDALLLKLPILGEILRKNAVAKFCRTLSTLVSSGVPILDGLEITAKTSGNVIVEDAVRSTRKSIERGETISAPLKETNVFPSMVTQMIGVGEATGALDTMLSKIADFYEEEVETAVSGMMKLMEPIMIAFLGVVVGGIVIAMYLPIFGLIGQLSGG
jgi:type IV pilus assembly protein PilC